MPQFEYASPVNQLLTLGDPRGQSAWPDYQSLGLSDVDVPELIRMMQDEVLRAADPESKEVWANLHAWRALGQLRAESAIEPLLQLFRRIDEDDDDWIGEELPEVMGMIGAVAIPALVRYLADERHPKNARIEAARGLVRMAELHPETRAACVAALTEQLERVTGTDAPLILGFIISYLLDLNAVESATAIERVFATKRVDVTICGDWEDVQIELGLKTEREHERDQALFDSFLPSGVKQLRELLDKRLLDDDRSQTQGPQTSRFVETAGLPRASLSRQQQQQQDAKAKAKRKQAKKSRQKNRKRK